jgi:hypothetical protein
MVFEMSRGPHTFRQSDLTRAVKALRAAGVDIVRVEIEHDRIVVVAGTPATTAEAALDEGVKAWDKHLGLDHGKDQDQTSKRRHRT